MVGDSLERERRFAIGGIGSDAQDTGEAGGCYGAGHTTS